MLIWDIWCLWQETRYRQRYLDLMTNPGVRDIFVTRARIISYVRRYFDDRGFLEVLPCTPVCNVVLASPAMYV
jgi:lysyl-tRNA synthetase, class II